MWSWVPRAQRVSSPCPSYGQVLAEVLAAQVPPVPAHSLNLVCKPILSPHLGQISQIHFPLCATKGPTLLQLFWVRRTHGEWELPLQVNVVKFCHE